MPSRVRVDGDLFHGRVPDGAIYVGRAAPGLRTSPWANPFKVGRPVGPTVRLAGGVWTVAPSIAGSTPAGTAEVITWYSWAITTFDLTGRVASELAGRDLACWCRETQPCHGDVLMTFANPGWVPPWMP
jgi:hypothetical protein